mgnify:FL=1
MYEQEFQHIGLNIKKFRKKEGITQQILADKIGKSLNFVGKIEVGFDHPSLYTLIDIAKALNVSLKDLFEDV